MTKPPVCWDRWRGKPTSSSASRRARRRVASAGSSPVWRIVVRLQAVVAPAPDRPGQDIDRVFRQAERLADLADRAARPVGDDGRRQPGAVAAVFAVDILDHLLAPLMLEIDVDIRRLVALGRDEALEQQIDLAGIDGSDAEAVADRGVGGRAPALTQDFLPAGIAHDVMHRQEIGRVAELPDQFQLMPHGRYDPGTAHDDRSVPPRRARSAVRALVEGCFLQVLDQRDRHILVDRVRNLFF